MLIRVTVNNFLSFEGDGSISLLASLERSHPNHIIKNKNRNLPRLLKGALIYGANASGKSNLVKAMSFAKKIITNPAGPNQRIKDRSFRLSNSGKNKPFKIDFEIVAKNIAYSYGFEIKKSKIVEEWLYKIDKKSEEQIFVRTENKNFSFGSFVEKLSDEDQQFFNFLARGTKENNLFLPEAISRNIENTCFKDVFDWFEDTLKIITPSTKSHGVEFMINQDESFKDFLENILSDSNTGIKNIEIREIDAGKTKIPKKIIDDLRSKVGENENLYLEDVKDGFPILLKKKDDELIAYEINTAHTCSGEREDTSFTMADESDGTRRIIELSPAFYEMGNNKKESVYVIDEIDRSLHPHLTRMLVDMAFNKTTERSQVIITTHESRLLDVSLLRRDEIWFVEKNETGSSEVYSLNEFKPRYDKDIGKDYLLGRYGAIPFVGGATRLEFETNE